MRSFHDKFIAAVQAAQAYTKFWVAFAGGVLIVISQNVPIDPVVTQWITTALAIATAFSVYAFPNTVPPVDTSASEIAYNDIREDVLADLADLTPEQREAAVQAAFARRQ